jgi:hypothetical protein
MLGWTKISQISLETCSISVSKHLAHLLLQQFPGQILTTDYN